MTKNEFIKRWNKLQEKCEWRYNRGTGIYTCHRISDRIGTKALLHYNRFAPSMELFDVVDFHEYGVEPNELRLLFLEFWFNFVIGEKSYLEF